MSGVPTARLVETELALRAALVRITQLERDLDAWRKIAMALANERGRP